MANVTIDGTTYETVHIPTAKTNILLVKAAGGFLGCGYFDVNVASRTFFKTVLADFALICT